MLTFDFFYQQIMCQRIISQRNFGVGIAALIFAYRQKQRVMNSMHHWQQMDESLYHFILCAYRLPGFDE